MRKFKTMALALSMTALLSTGMVFAAEYSSPIEVLSNLTGSSVEEIYEQRGNKTLGSIAQEEGVSDEFKAAMLENKKAILEQRVKDGVLTQEQADAILERMETNIANCDGTGAMMGNGIGKGAGCGFGLGNGQGMMRNGNAPKNGQGFGQKNGMMFNQQ